MLSILVSGANNKEGRHILLTLTNGTDNPENFQYPQPIYSPQFLNSNTYKNGCKQLILAAVIERLYFGLTPTLDIEPEKRNPFDVSFAFDNLFLYYSYPNIYYRTILTCISLVVYTSFKILPHKSIYLI